MREKWRCGFCLCVFLVIIYSFLFYSVKVHATEQDDMENALSTYFMQRENEFISTEKNIEENNVVGRVMASSEEISRSNFIENWIDELSIEVEDSSIEYHIENILEDNEEIIKIQVYEWVWIDYICKNDEERQLETMGFGTHHILEFEKNNELDLLSDSYMEITGYKTGTIENLYILECLKNEAIDNESNGILAYEQNSFMPTSISSLYAPGNAVSYSNSWCGQSKAGTSSSMNPSNYNPLYYYYSGADCCNFVSQCLKAGGMSTGGDWTVTTNSSNTVTEDTNYSKSGSAWRYVPSFETYWVGKGHVKAQITSTSQAIAGNVIYYLKSDGYSSNHIMFIVGVNSNGQVLINGHNNDAYRYPLTLSSKKYYTIEFTHCYTNVKSYTTTQHTVLCSLCNDTKVEAHTFTMSPGGRTCTVCGYSTTN